MKNHVSQSMSNKNPPKSVQIVFSFEESNGTKVKVETKKDSKEVKAKATKTPKVTPPSNTTVEEMRGEGDYNYNS